jgi:hypothetical protein
MAPTWVHIIHIIPIFPKSQRFHRFPTSMVEFHPPSNPMAGLDPCLKHKLKGNSTFGALALNAPFSFVHAYPPKSQDTELPKGPKISPRGSSLWSFQLIYDTIPQSSGVPKSLTSEGSTLARVDVLNAEARIGGF